MLALAACKVVILYHPLFILPAFAVLLDPSMSSVRVVLPVCPDLFLSLREDRSDNCGFALGETASGRPRYGAQPNCPGVPLMGATPGQLGRR